MLSFTDAAVSLKCLDCDSSFNSASSLLKHFAQHVSQNEFSANLESSRNTEHGKPCGLLAFQKEKKMESILEKVLKRSALQYLKIHPKSPISCTSDQNVRSSDSSSSSSSTESATSPEHSQDVSYSSKDMVQEIGIRARHRTRHGFHSPTDVPLVKCDLQKRLENCIVKLVSKRDAVKKDGENSTLDHSDKNNYKSGEHLSLKDDLKSYELPGLEGVLDFSMSVNMRRWSESVWHNNESTSVTEQIKVKDGTKMPRGASSRKQLTPKKIYHHPNGKPVDCVNVSEPLSTVGEKISSPTKRKHPCHLCSKVFGWSTDLKRHILTHTGERPFKCQLCDATFTRNFILQKHEAKVHSQNSLASIRQTLGIEDSVGDIQNGYTTSDGRWVTESPSKRAKNLQCNRISSYEISSQEALNIL